MTEATDDSGESPHPKVENMIKADVLQEAIRDIENIVEEQLSEQGAYMQQCSVLQGRIKEIKKTAKKDGIPLKELNTILADRALDRKKAKLRAELEPDQKILFDQMKEALGPLAGTPMGDAAMASAAAQAKAATTAPSAEAKAAGVDAIGGAGPLDGTNPVFSDPKTTH